MRKAFPFAQIFSFCANLCCITLVKIAEWNTVFFHSNCRHIWPHWPNDIPFCFHLFVAPKPFLNKCHKLVTSTFLVFLCNSTVIKLVTPGFWPRRKSFLTSRWPRHTVQSGGKCQEETIYAIPADCADRGGTGQVHERKIQHSSPSVSVHTLK